MKSLEQLVEEVPVNVSLKMIGRELDALKNPVTLKYVKMYADVQTPVRAHESDAGLDIFAYGEPVWDSLGFYQYSTGIKLQIPKGYWVAIYPRSSISKYDIVLANSVGVIDEDYVGEIMFRFKPTTKPTKIYVKGDRIGQLVLCKKHNFVLEQIENIQTTSRGEGGFGSSGN